MTLVAMAVPVDADADTPSANAAWLMSLAGFDTAPAGTATVYHDGTVQEVPVAEMFEMAAARAGDVDLATALERPASAHDPFGVGDVWVIEIGVGACPEPVVLVENSPVPPAEPHDDLYLYQGHIGEMTSPGNGQGAIYDWTTQLTTGGSYTNRPATIAGQSDLWCSTYLGWYYFFPFLDGVAFLQD